MSREPAWNGALDTLARLGAAVVGSLPVTVLLCVLVARLAPVPTPLAATLGILAVLPLWALLGLVVLLFRSAVRAWGAVIVAAIGLGFLAWVLGPLP